MPPLSHPSAPRASSCNNSGVRRAARTIELVTETAGSRTGSTLMNGLLVLGTTGLLMMLGVLVLRLWLITTVQEPVAGQLEYLITWCGLPPSLNGFTWMLTFGLGAVTAWPLVKKFAFFATGIPWFCPRPAEWALLCIIPASSLIAPLVQTLCPIREVDPTTTAWFYPDRDASTGQPHGRIGYLRDADGTWHFYNVPSFLRESDALPVQRVTPEVRQQWQQDYARQQEQQRRLEQAEREALAAQEAERQRQAEHLAQLRLETARQQAEVARAAEAEATAQKARQEAEAARQRAETEAAARLAAEKARREAEQQAQARQAEAETARRAAETAHQRLEQEREAETKRRQREVAEFLASSPRREDATSPNVSLRLDSVRRSMPTSQAQPPTGQAFNIQSGLWRHIHVRGDRVEVWCDGPVALGADHSAPRSFPGGAWVRFQQGAQTLHATPAGPGATHIRVRKMQR